MNKKTSSIPKRRDCKVLVYSSSSDESVVITSGESELDLSDTNDKDFDLTNVDKDIELNDFVLVEFATKKTKKYLLVRSMRK